MVGWPTAPELTIICMFNVFLFRANCVQDAGVRIWDGL